MDEEVKNKAKLDLKQKIKLFFKIAIVIILIVIILFPAAWYVVKKDDGSFEDGDWSNTPFGASQYTHNISIGSDGKITTNMTAQELWDRLISEGSRVDVYLDGPEELQKLMNAELITQYLDTRPNPDEPIDWEAIADVNSNEIQGIIKLKRAQADGTTSTMTYVDPETFQTYIDNYNVSGSEADRNEALSHFTIESRVVRNENTGNSGEEGKVESLDGMLFIGDSITHGLDQAHTSTYWLSDENIALLQNSLFSAEPSTYAYHWLQRIDSLPDTSEVNSVCVLLGVNNPTSQEQMKELIDRLVVKYSGKNIYIQKVFPLGRNGSGFSYTPDEMNAMIDAYNADIQQYCESKQNVYFIDTTEGYVTSDGYLQDDKTSDGVHLTDYNTWVENIAEAVIGNNSDDSDDSDDSEDNSDDNTGEDILYWPTTSTTITSNFGYRNSPTAGASSNHKGIDIGVPSGSEVYAMEAGQVTMAGWSDSGGYMVTIDHGNGYVSKYLHNNEVTVSAGDTVEKGQVVAISGNTGISTGPHLHFQIEYNGEPIDPLSFKYNNGMGNGTGGIGIGSGSGDSSDSTTTTVFYAKVATWSSVTDTVESNDPDVETYSTTTYRMTTTNVNFQDFVSGYTMPFYYLWVLLVMSEEQDFVLELADLVYNSEIEITVHDNLTVNTNVNVYTYTEKTKTETMATVTVMYGSSPSDANRYNASGGPWIDEESTDYTTTHTTITSTNTLDIQLTKADVWIVNYTRHYTYSRPEATVTNTENDLEEMPYPATPNETRTGSDTYGHANALLQSEMARWTEDYEYVDGAVISVTERIYYATVNRHESITNTVERNQYIASPPNIEEKTDKDSEEPNFVTILSSWKHRKAKNYLIDGSWMVFDFLESHETTENMVDLTKYLFYKVSNKTRFWNPDEEFDWSIFDPANFETNNESTSGTSGIDGIPGQIYDFLLGKGVPAVGAAAILGNIQGESSFDPTVVNSIGATGLCQWLGGRLDGLRALADSRGTDWTDVETQLEYMWQELNTGYTGVKDVIMNATTEDDLEYATWYWGRHFEIFFIGSWPSSRGETATRYQYAQEWYAQFKQNGSSGGSSQGNSEIVEIARTKLGCPYVWGATGPDTFDCSGLVYWVYQQVGISLPRTTYGYPPYIGTSNEVSWSEAQPGDIVWNDHHMGIYLGNDEFIHAPQTGDVVKISSGASSRFTNVFRFTN